MTSFSSAFDRSKKSTRYYLGGLVRYLSDKEVFLWSQAIAFKVLVTLVPLIILVTGIMGLVIKGEASFEAVSRVIRDFFPADSSDSLLSFLKEFQGASDTFTAIGIAGLLFSAMTLFTTLRIVLANVFREEWHDHRTILGGYLFDIRMVLQVGFFFLLTISLSVFVQNAESFELIQRFDAVIQVGWRRVLRMVGLVLPFVLSTAMFFQLFFFTPKPKPPKRSVLIGSLVTAILWELAKYGFTLYAVRVGSFGGVGLAAGTFGLIIALVFWAYYSGIVFILGALVTLLHETRYRQLPHVGPFSGDEEALEDELLNEPPESADMSILAPEQISPG